jgi:tetratricopeptide (TPR) repeat protein
MKCRYIVSMLAVFAICVCLFPPVLADTSQIQDNATDYYNLAQMAISAGKYEQAVGYFDEVLAENTTLIAKGDGLMYTYKDKTAALTDLGRYDEALSTADAGLIRYPNSTGLWNNKGYALYKAGRNNEAVDAYSHAVTLDPSYVKGWINKGNALSAAGRYQDAIDAYNKALALDAGNEDATNGIAQAQKGAASALPVTTIALVIVVIAGAGIAAWYFMFRKPATEAPSEQQNGKNKK